MARTSRMESLLRRVGPALCQVGLRLDPRTEAVVGLGQIAPLVRLERKRLASD